MQRTLNKRTLLLFEMQQFASDVGLYRIKVGRFLRSEDTNIPMVNVISR